MSTNRQIRNELIAMLAAVAVVVWCIASSVITNTRLNSLERTVKTAPKSIALCNEDHSVCVDIDAEGIVRSGGTLVPCSEDPRKQWWPCSQEVKP